MDNDALPRYKIEQTKIQRNYFIGVDPAMGPDHYVISKIHPDGRVEILNINHEKS